MSDWAIYVRLSDICQTERYMSDCISILICAAVISCYFCNKCANCAICHFRTFLLKLKWRVVLYLWRVWRYQRGNQNPTKNRQHNGQMKKWLQDKQRYTKHAHKTKDRVTWTPLKTGGELRYYRSNIF
jgi:hypothetical protein